MRCAKCVLLCYISSYVHHSVYFLFLKGVYSVHSLHIHCIPHHSQQKIKAVQSVSLVDSITLHTRIWITQVIITKSSVWSTKTQFALPINEKAKIKKETKIFQVNFEKMCLKFRFSSWSLQQFIILGIKQDVYCLHNFNLQDIQILKGTFLLMKGM